MDLHPELQRTLEEYRKVRAFDPAAWVEEKCQKFNHYLKRNHLSGAIVSVSGGVDSAVTFALLDRCSKLENAALKRFIAVAQPIHSSDWALNRARELCDTYNHGLIVIDQTDIHDSIVSRVTDKFNVEGSQYATGQLRSYQRTPVNYYLAQLLTQQGNPAVVMGTGNQDEDGYLAYFCKAGDGVVDVQLISDLHKKEVFQVGEYLGIPKSILEAQPSADLWEGQTDEEELGVSYDFIELFTGFYLKLSRKDQKKYKNSLSDEACKEFHNLSKKCRKIHRQNKHKLNYPKNL